MARARAPPSITAAPRLLQLLLASAADLLAPADAPQDPPPLRAERALDAVLALASSTLARDRRVRVSRSVTLMVDPRLRLEAVSPRRNERALADLACSHDERAVAQWLSSTLAELLKSPARVELKGLCWLCAYVSMSSPTTLVVVDTDMRNAVECASRRSTPSSRVAAETAQADSTPVVVAPPSPNDTDTAESTGGGAASSAKRPRVASDTLVALPHGPSRTAAAADHMGALICCPVKDAGAPLSRLFPGASVPSLESICREEEDLLAAIEICTRDTKVRAAADPRLFQDGRETALNGWTIHTKPVVNALDSSVSVNVKLKAPKVTHALSYVTLCIMRARDGVLRGRDDAIVYFTLMRDLLAPELPEVAKAKANYLIQLVNMMSMIQRVVDCDGSNMPPRERDLLDQCIEAWITTFAAYRLAVAPRVVT